MKYVSLLSGVFLASVLLVTPVRAVDGLTVKVPEGNRLCLLDITVMGVQDEFYNELENHNGTIREVANFALSKGLTVDSVLENHCGLKLRDSQHSTLKNGSAVFPIGQRINMKSLFQSAMSGTRAVAERSPKPAVYFENRRIKQLNQDGSVSNCNPIYMPIYDEMLKITNRDAVNLDTTFITDDPVTEDSCPLINVNFYQDVGDEESYLMNIIIRDGGGPNTKAIVPDERLLAENTDIDTNKLKSYAGGLNLISAKSVPELIGQALKILMGIVGSIALAVLIFAGFMWMMAAGNAQREKQSMEMMTWGALGLIVILSSYSIVQFIFESVL